MPPYNDDHIPDEVARHLTIPHVDAPGRDEFKGSVTPGEIASLKDAREIAIAASFNKVEAKLSWLMEKVPPIYGYLRVLEARHIASERRSLALAKLFVGTIATAFISFVLYRALGIK